MLVSGGSLTTGTKVALIGGIKRLIIPDKGDGLIKTPTEIIAFLPIRKIMAISALVKQSAIILTRISGKGATGGDDITFDPANSAFCYTVFFHCLAPVPGFFLYAIRMNLAGEHILSLQGIAVLSGMLRFFPDALARVLEEPCFQKKW